MNSISTIKSESRNRNVCLHSRNIMAYIDLNEADLSLLPFGKHLMSCSSCQEEFLKSKKVLQHIDKYIPNEKMATAQSDQMGKEIAMMMRKVKLKEFEKGLLKVQLFAQGTKAVLSDLGAILISPQMGLVYVAALLLGLGIRFLQS